VIERSIWEISGKLRARLMECAVMIKRIFLLVRRPVLSREEFARHWREIHGPLAKQLPNVVRYIQDHIVESSTFRGDSHHPDLPEVDGIAKFWFEDKEAMEAAFATPAAKTLFADGTKFIELVNTYIVEEHTVIDQDPRRPHE
jgi:uncharacterized protein (TIGR02118 family)